MSLARHPAPLAQRVALHTRRCTSRASRNSTELLTQQVDEIEIRFRIAENPDSQVQIPVRIMATSMSGQWLKVDVYREYLDPQTGKATQFCMLGADGAEEACFLEPYPMPGTLQQKRSIARAIGTVSYTHLTLPTIHSV